MIDIILITNKNLSKVIETVVEIIDYTSNDYNLIYTGLNESASKNRNYGLSKVKSDIFIMLDDDIQYFYKNWANDLIEPLLIDKDILISSARLLDSNKNFGHMMGDNKIYKEGWYESKKSTYKNYFRLPTACMAIRKNNLLFDENFIGSGYEDTDYFNRISEAFPHKKVVINNNCQVVHRNEEKNQGGEYFIRNKEYYLSIYPDDMTVKNQIDWTLRKR